MTARLGRDPFDDHAPLRIEGVIGSSSAGFVLDLRASDENGVALGQRQLASQSPDCAELSEAAVLAIALTIDPNAPLVPPAVAPAAVMKTESPAPIVTPPPPCPPVGPLMACPKPAPPAPPALAAPRVSVALRVPFALGLVPGFAAGVSVAGRVTGERGAMTLGMSWFPEAVADDERFSIGVSVAQLGGCWRAWSFARADVALCAELQVGSQHAVVRQLNPLEPGDRLFVAAGVGSQLWLDLTAGVQLELGVSAGFPLWRPEFALRPSDRTIFESPAIIPLGFVGLAFGAPGGQIY